MGVQLIPQDWRNNPDRIEDGWRPFRSDITLTQDGEASEGQIPWIVEGIEYTPGGGRHWRTHERGRIRLAKAGRVNPSRSRPFYIESFGDSPTTNSSNIWTENLAGAQGKVYVVQTNERVLERCILMTTDPGDLVLDPTCGSGTTAYVAEQWGRRWITIDTSRVALAPGPRPHHGRPLPLLPAGRQPGRAVEGIRTVPTGALGYDHLRQHPAGFRVRASAPHHPAGHRQQHRNRRHLRGLPGKAGTLAGTVKPGPRPELGGVGDSPGSGATRGLALPPSRGTCCSITTTRPTY